MSGSLTIFGDVSSPGSVLSGLSEYAFDEAMSLLLHALDPSPETVTWSLTSEDEAASNMGVNLFGDGEPNSVTVQHPSSVTQSGGFMTDSPSTTPTSAGPILVSIEHTYDSKHREHNLGMVAVILEAMRRSMKALRRRPRLRFKYGMTNIPVWLTEFTVDPFEGYWPGTENPKRLRVSIQCVEAATHKLERASIRPAETSWIRLPAGHSFELIAAIRYGDPNMGVLIRRTNPDMFEEKPGELIRLLEPEHPLMQEAIAPRAPAFVERYQELVQAKALARLGRRGSPWSDFADQVVVSEDAPLIWE